MLYGCTLAAVAWPWQKSSVWRPTSAAWLGPAALLVAQVVAVAGLVALVFALRGVARRLARGEDLPQGAGPRLDPHGFMIAPGVALPLASVLAPTACIVLAAHGVLGPIGLVVSAIGLPGLVWAIRPDPWAPAPTDRLHHRPRCRSAASEALRSS